jgi:hypothetical protein
MASINRHFKIESWLMVALFLVPVIFALIAAILVPYIRGQIAIDRCLDAGGSYNYKTDTCVTSAPR